jgi:ABC-type glutathione transport system ATPase component
MFSLPQIPGSGELLLVTDELSSPADFVLHADLAAHLKDPTRHARCTVLSVSESLARWKTIASKSVSIYSSEQKLHT